jgi:hypothetical protein
MFELRKENVDESIICDSDMNPGFTNRSVRSNSNVTPTVEVSLTVIPATLDLVGRRFSQLLHLCKERKLKSSKSRAKPCSDQICAEIGFQNRSRAATLSVKGRELRQNASTGGDNTSVSAETAAWKANSAVSSTSSFKERPITSGRRKERKVSSH